MGLTVSIGELSTTVDSVRYRVFLLTCSWVKRYSEGMARKKHIVEKVLQNRSLDRRHCFLCGVRLNTTNTSREHIFPKFLLNRFKLWEQRLTLINGTEIPYRKVVVPCCKTCNNKYIGRIDRKIAAAVKGGFDEFAKLDEVLVFQWLSRILYSILYLETITPRDPRFKRRKILKKTFFRSLETAYLFLNSVRIKAEFHKPYPWSIFIFKAQTHSDVKLNFDFKDNPIMFTIAVRMGDIGIVAALQENGALQTLEEESLGITQARALELHPLQFCEVAARIFYAASLLDRVPKYMSISGPNDEMHIVSIPIGGLSSKPIFGDFDPEAYARLLSRSTGIPVEQLYFPGKGIWTFLHDETGTPRHMQFE